MSEIINETPLNTEQQEALVKVKDQIAKATDADFLEEVIKSNKSEFTHKDVKYKVGKLNYEQKQEIYRERVKKFTELLRDKGYSLEKDLKKDYLDRGIDVDAMTAKIKALEDKKDVVRLRLGEMLKKEDNTTDCEKLKKEIEALEDEQKQIAMEKQVLLEFSIENQVMIYMYNYMTYLIAEKFEGDKWVRAFPSFKEFSKLQDDELIGKLAFLVTLLTQDSV